MSNLRCGPVDKSVLFDQDSHVSTDIWNGVDRGKLDVRQSTSMLDEWKLLPQQINYLEMWGFGTFANPRAVLQNDVSLISALVERWRPETNSFHFTFGEMTITLEDVYMLLGLPVSGLALTFDEGQDPKSTWRNVWGDRRLTSQDKENAYTKSGVSLKWLRDRYSVCPSTDPDIVLLHTRAYVLYLCGAILFPTKSKNIVHPRYIQALVDPVKIGTYAWGAAVLGVLYRNLYKASKRETKQISGCITVLQLWAYERLVPGRPKIAPNTELIRPRALAWAVPVGKYQLRHENPHHHLRVYRGMFDNFDINWVTWQPYTTFYDRPEFHVEEGRIAALGRVPLIHWNVIEYQMPDRVLRQFGCMHSIPGPQINMVALRKKSNPFERTDYSVLYAPFLRDWDAFVSEGVGLVDEASFNCSTDEYLQWYRRISRIKINPIQNKKPEKQQPRDYFDNLKAIDVIETAMATFNRISNNPTPDVFYQELPTFLKKYDSFMMEWKGPEFERPQFVRHPLRKEDVQDLNLQVFTTQQKKPSAYSCSMAIPSHPYVDVSQVEKETKNMKEIQIVDCEDKKEEDWLPLPPKTSTNTYDRIDDSTREAPRLKKQKLFSYAQLAEDSIRTVEESVKSDLSASLQSPLDSVTEPLLKPPSNPPKRSKIIISIQDKDGLKRFRVYMDDIFERLFMVYADKVKINMKMLAFYFDGDEISLTTTPTDLGMEDNDIIEVHVKSN